MATEAMAPQGAEHWAETEWEPWFEAVYASGPLVEERHHMEAAVEPF